MLNGLSDRIEPEADEDGDDMPPKRQKAAKKRKPAKKAKAKVSAPQLSPSKPSKPTSSRLKLIREHRLAKLLDVHPSTIWRWKQNGILPPPVVIGGVKGWTEDEIADLIEKRRQQPSGARS